MMRNNRLSLEPTATPENLWYRDLLNAQNQYLNQLATNDTACCLISSHLTNHELADMPARQTTWQTTPLPSLAPRQASEAATHSKLSTKTSICQIHCTMRNDHCTFSTLFHGLSRFLCPALPHIDQKLLSDDLLFLVQQTPQCLVFF